jgi:predicted transcriptional regulator
MGERLRDSYTVDLASELDSQEEILADELEISVAKARLILRRIKAEVSKNKSISLASAIGIIIQSYNCPLVIYAVAVASGLNELNGIRSQSEIARELGCTRALVSYYVLGIRDLLSGSGTDFDCLKYRKSQKSREVFRQKATDPFTAAKQAAKAKIFKTDMKSYIIITTDKRRFIFQAKTEDLARKQATDEGLEVKSITEV